MRGAASVAREMWRLFEPIHAVTYFAPEPRAAFEEAGLRGFWRGYFAGRAAPLGAVPAAPVVAAFFSFAPAMVARAVPDVWSRAAPDRVLEARRAGAVAALARLLGRHEETVDEAASLLEQAVDGLDCAGRVLGAANAGLPPPGEPLARLWHAATVLREHRGDGHVAGLVTAGLTGCQALVWRAALDVPRDTLQPARGWTDQEWEAAAAALVKRGWLTGDGAPTADGRLRHVEVEALTDAAATAPWQALTGTEVNRLFTVLRPLALACMAELPYPNAIGLAAPDTHRRL